MANRRDLEIISHFRSQALIGGGPTVLGRDFPLGEGWYRLALRFNLVVVIGTGAGPVAEGELLVIKGIKIRTSIPWTFLSTSRIRACPYRKIPSLTQAGITPSRLRY